MTSNSPNAQRGIINWRIIGWGSAILLLLLPLAAMQFTNEVNWTISDFVFAAVLLGSVGFILELAVRRAGDWTYRAAMACAAAAGFLLFWANGAVGLIGSETNDANGWFYLVPLLALLGGLITRAQPAAMAWVMAAAAVAQIAIACTVMAVSWPQREYIWIRELVLSGGFFGALWLASAALFRAAARRHDKRVAPLQRSS